MAQTVISDIAAIPLQPTVPASPTQYNPVLTTVDPINGNYFTATGRDLVTFYCLPVALAPAYSGASTYTAGQVVNSGGTAYIAIASVPLATPPPNGAYWAAYTVSTISMISAPDACTARTANFTYTVPDGAFTEFLVLPSSVFTQANGQVQFTGSSNLLKVWVRSL